MSDLNRTIGEVLGSGLMAHDGVYRGDAITKLMSTVEKVEPKAEVVNFREAADYYHGDNPEYQLSRLRRVRQYLRQERVWERDSQRWISLTMAEGIVLGVIRKNFNPDEGFEEEL